MEAGHRALEGGCRGIGIATRQAALLDLDYEKQMDVRWA